MVNQPPILGELFQGFSKLNRQERLEQLVKMGALTHQDATLLRKNEALECSLAENLVENVIGYFQIPLGVAANLCIDDRDYAIPMAIEETSVIAALSKTAKWLRKDGYITTRTVGTGWIVGQIQLASVQNSHECVQRIQAQTTDLIALANQTVAQGLYQRGGGVQDITTRILPSQTAGTDMLVIHVQIDPCDTMGANIATQICEMLKPHIETITSETVNMCIISNLSDDKLVHAQIRISRIDPKVGEAIAEAAYFAHTDPYRAATHNKGILNGIDPVLIATGNDWRAVNAAIHAYAARSGQYRAVSQWYFEHGDLIGEMTVPITVGIVGGMTKLHPTAQMSLRMMRIDSAAHLARITAAVGLVQNLGALRALTTVGLVKGHMRLHITNLSLSAGAQEAEIPLMQKRLEELLSFRKRVTLSNAIDVLEEIRDNNLIVTPTQEQTA